MTHERFIVREGPSFDPEDRHRLFIRQLTNAHYDQLEMGNWALKELSSGVSGTVDLKRLAIKKLPATWETEVLLVELLRDPRPEIQALRRPIIRKLKDSQSDVGIAALVDALQSQDLKEVGLAIKALAGMQAHGAPQALADYAADASRPLALRHAAARRIQPMSEAAIAISIEALQSGDIKQVKLAIKALGGSKLGSAPEALARYAASTSHPLPLRLDALAGLKDSSNSASLDIIASFLNQNPSPADCVAEAALEMKEWAWHQDYATQVSLRLLSLCSHIYQENDENNRRLILESMNRRIAVLEGTSDRAPLLALSSVVKGYLATFNSEVASLLIGKKIETQTPLLHEYGEVAYWAVDAIAAAADSENTLTLLNIFSERTSTLRRGDPVIADHIFHQGDPNVFRHIFNRLVGRNHPDLPDMMMRLADEVLNGQKTCYPLQGSLHCLAGNSSERVEEWMVTRLRSSNTLLKEIGAMHSGNHPHPVDIGKRLFAIKNPRDYQAAREYEYLVEDSMRNEVFKRLRFTGTETRLALIKMLPAVNADDDMAPNCLAALISLIGPVQSEEERSLVTSMLPGKRKWWVELADRGLNSHHPGFVSSHFKGMVERGLLSEG